MLRLYTFFIRPFKHCSNHSHFEIIFQYSPNCFSILISNIIYSSDGKTEFSAVITPVLSLT